MKLSTCLYHWSPYSRRASILLNGLVVGSESPISGRKSTSICFHPCPVKAWALKENGDNNDHHPYWDLWMVQGDSLEHFEISSEWEKEEVRTGLTVPSAAVHYVGSRHFQDPV